MEHLKFARAYLTGAENWLIQVRKQDTTFYERQMFATMAEMLSHLEAQQETPASEPSSAPTTGLAERHSPSLGANPDTLPTSLVLTEITSAGSRSIVFTPQESEVMSGRYLSLPRIHEWLMTSGSIRDGDRGVASPKGVKCQ